MRDTMFFSKLRVFLGQWRWRAHRRGSWMKARLRQARRRLARFTRQASLVTRDTSGRAGASPLTPYASRFSIEPLEPRILLAADLTGVIQSSALLDPAVPTNTASAIVQVQNIGNQRVAQSQVGVYASLDTTLDSSDVLLGSTNTNALNAGANRNVTVDLTVPTSLVPGAYRLLAKVDNANVINENSETNNVAIGGTVNVAWKFGTVPGRTGTTTLTLRDADGTQVTFSLTGAGMGEVIRDGTNWDLKVIGTTASSAVTILTNSAGNGRVTLNDIHVFGPLATFLAATTDLTGTLAIDGPVTIPGLLPGTVTLGSVQGGTVALPSVEALTITGAVTNAKFYIGTTLGQDGQPGGTGANADTYGQGRIGLFTVTGAMSNTAVRVGVDPVDGTYGNSNDQLLGGTSSAIDGIVIGGTLSADTRFYAGKFPTQYLHRLSLKPTAGDIHFVTLVSGGPTTLNAALQQDTGSSTSDKLTNDPTIVGSLTDADGIASFTAGFGTTPTFNVVADRQPDGSFTFNRARLEQINGGMLTDGTYVLKFQATDALGTSTQITVPFTLDTAIPTLTLDLDPASDTAPVGDQQTTSATVILTGQTEANAAVALVGLGRTTTADAAGVYSFTNITLALGANAFTVRATDPAGNQREFNRTVTRLAVNQPPVLTAIGNQTVDEGTALTFTATATDPDAGQTLTFALVDGASGAVPQGASINPTTGAFSWTPTETQGPGTFIFDVVVTDNGSPTLLSARETITVTVNEVNQAPVLTAIPAQTATVGQELTFTAVGVDADRPDNTLTYSLEGNFSAGATIDSSTGLFTWTPTAAQVGGPHGFMIRVTDNGSPNLFAEQNVQVLVEPKPNQAPVLNPVGNQSVDEGQQLQFFANATDPDGTTTFTFALEDGVGGQVPDGMVVDPVGTFRWTPTEAQGPGSYTFDVVVTDHPDNSTPALRDRETITVTVDEVPQAPTLDAISEQTIQAGQELTFTAVGHDPDIPASAVTYSLHGTVPAGAAIDPDTGVFTWTPTAAQVGPQTVTVRVTDSDSVSLGLFAQQVVSITVNGVLDADLDGIPDAVEGAGPNGGDANQDRTPDSQQAHVVSFQNAVDQQYVTLAGPTGTQLRQVQTTSTVPPDAPADVQFPLGLTSFELHGVTPGGTADVTMLLPDGADMNSAYKFGPEAGSTTAHWYEFNLVGGTGVEITGNQALFHFIDGGRGDADLTANGVIVDPAGLGVKNTPPVLTPIGAKVVNEGAELRFTAQATDANVGQTLRFSLENAPFGAAIDPVTGLFTWTPGQDRGPSTYRFDVVVTDNGVPARSTRETIAVTVVEPDAVFFQGLGDLPGGTFFRSVEDVSADGSVVVGTARSANGTEAYRWTASDGMVGLGDLPGGVFDSAAMGVSADGSVVVGTARSANGNEAYRWTASDGMVGLGDLPGGFFDSAAMGVSADGSVVAGSSIPASGSIEAFRWTERDGMVGLGGLPGEISNSDAGGVSADGSVVVGTARSANSTEAYRWTASDGMVGLGDLPGGTFFSSVEDVSADGSVVVGTARSANGTEAYRWTASDGMVGLGDLPGGVFFSSAQAASTDGTLVVGTGKSANGDEAFVWDAVQGMRNLRDVLVAEFGLGPELTGWTLREATGISDDGRTITGRGINPQGLTEAWRVRLPANQAPVNTVPGTQTVNEDTALPLSGLTVTDADSNLLSTQLAVAHGTLTVDLTGGATISAGANGTNTLTVNGTQAQINAALATLTYQGLLNYSGLDTLTVMSADSRGATDTDNVDITVTPVVTTTRWVNPAGGDWDVASNWSTNLVPEANDDVIIDAAVQNPITSVNPITIKSLTLSAGTVVFNGPTAMTTLTQTGGMLTGNGTVTLTGSGAQASAWSAGTMIGSGTTIVQGELDVAVGTVSPVLARDLSIGDGATPAEMRVTGDGTFLMNDPTFTQGRVTIANHSTVSLTGAVDMVVTGGVRGGAFIKVESGGRLVNSGASLLTQFNSVFLINNGLVDIQSGTLRLVGGGSLTENGNFNVAAGATLDFNVGPEHVFAGNGGITGTGTVDIDGPVFKRGEGTTTTVTPTVRIFSALIAESGTLVLTGTVTNNAALIVAEGSTLTVSGNLTNYDDATHTLTGGPSVRFEIRGTLRVDQADIVRNEVELSLIGPAAQFINMTGGNALANFAMNTSQGTFFVDQRTFTTGASLTNSGSLHVGADGTIQVSGQFTNTSDAVSGFGIVTIDMLSSTEFGRLVVIGTATIEGGGLFFMQNGPLQAGDRLQFMTFASRTGFFIQLSLPDGTILDQSDPGFVELVMVNPPPVLASVGDHTVAAGEPLTFTATATDPDPLDTLTFSLQGTSPEGASIDPVSGAFSWTPSPAQVGVHEITVRVTDSGTPALSDEETITVTVT